MTDIQHWRRMVQSSHVTTPDEPANVHKTPRTRIRPRISSYFSHHPSNAASSTKHEASAFSSMPRSFPGSLSSLDLIPYPHPEAEHLMEAMMTRLLAHPYKGLDPARNSSILFIFESYRALVDEKASLQKEFDEEIERRFATLVEVQGEQRLWEEEKREYNAKIKRLEAMIAKGNRTLESVRKARQESVLRRRIKPTEDSDDEPMMRHETVYEFLARSKRDDDDMRKSQRVLVTPRPPTSPARVRAQSQKTLEASMHKELPLGTPVSVGVSGLAQASFQGLQAASPHKCNRSQSLQDIAVNMADDAWSTLSSVSGFLSDEVGNKTIARLEENANHTTNIKHIAGVLSKRSGVSAESAVPRIKELLQDGLRSKTEAPRDSHTVGLAVPYSKGISSGETQTMISASMSHPNFGTPVQTLRSRSGECVYFNGKKAQQRPAGLAESDGRRFSFEPGDDSVMAGDQSSKGKVLRRSTSLDSLLTAPTIAPIAQAILPSVAASPRTSPLRDSQRTSKIPSPAPSASSLARLRREDSSSSLLTAIKHGEDISRRTSSIYSQPSSSSSRPSSSRQSSGMHFGNKMQHSDSKGHRVLAVDATRAVGAVRGISRSDFSNIELSSHSKQSSAQSNAIRRSLTVVQATELESFESKEESRPPKKHEGAGNGRRDSSS